MNSVLSRDDDAASQINQLLAVSPAVLYAGEPRDNFAITFITDNVLSRFGYEPEEILTQADFRGLHIHPVDKPWVYTDLPVVLQTGQHILEYRMKHKDGSYRWVRDELYLAGVDERGIPREIIGSWTDVTAYRRVEKNLETIGEEESKKSPRRSAELEKIKQDGTDRFKLFAYSVAHDLKNPAIAIHGLAKLLQKLGMDVLSVKGKQYCDQITRSSEEIVDLVEMVNVFARTKERHLSIKMIFPQELLAIIKEEFSAKLALRGLQLVEPAYFPGFRADRLSMLRVLRNLVDNALKHGGDSLSKIEIGYSESNEFHILSVSNDGDRIEREDCRNIFSPFSRTKKSRKIEGSGLGLAIVKEIAEQHGGRVQVVPGQEKGATFSVYISKKYLTSRLAEKG